MDSQAEHSKGAKEDGHYREGHNRVGHSNVGPITTHEKTGTRNGFKMREWLNHIWCYEELCINDLKRTRLYDFV